MSRRVHILKTDVPYRKAFFSVEEARLQHELYNGQMSAELVRISWERGDSAAVLMHDPVASTVILTEQFRYPTYAKGPGWLLEIPAGTVEINEQGNPVATLRRELLEEIGYNVAAFKYLYTFYVSPGGTSERIFLYYSRVSPKDKTAPGGGVLSEGEDVRLLVMRIEDALRKMLSGEIVDAKSIIALQWLVINRARL